jgi:hypothetical protein
LEVEAEVIKEPIPQSQYCSACDEQFSSYLTHINTVKHKSNSMAQNARFNPQIDDVIREMDVARRP